jgi:hypothetical protein
MPTDCDKKVPDADMLPDEREVLHGRGDELHETDEEELLTVEQVAENLNLNVE